MYFTVASRYGIRRALDIAGAISQTHAQAMWEIANGTVVAVPFVEPGELRVVIGAGLQLEWLGDHFVQLLEMALAI